jgi:FkbM family methyltransferase
MELPNGCSFTCDLRDAIAREVCFTGVYGALETALFKKLLGPGMVFVDVGANWGYFTLLASQLVGNSGRVISLEPDPRPFDLLHANVSRNGLSQVAIRQVAAANHQGVLTLVGYSEEDGNFGTSSIVGHSQSRHFEVPAAPLDSLLRSNDVTLVHLVKIDVEGAEDLVLAGMIEGLMGQLYKCVLLEFHPTLLAARGRDVADAIAPLTENGYRGWYLDHSQQAVRRAAYAREIEIGDCLSPLAVGGSPSRWPHAIFAPSSIDLLAILHRQAIG